MEDVKKALADYCHDAHRSPAKALAELAAELMLSDSEDPLHVYGPELIELLDKEMLK